MEEKRYTFKELTDMYSVDSKTLLLWARDLEFPLFAISPHKRYARESDLRKWEDSYGKYVFDSSSRTPIIPDWMK
jgi:hypothetical protein